MEDALQAILQAARQPFQQAAVVTDNSYLLIYPPEWELDFRAILLDRCYPELKSLGVPHEQLDLSGFLCDCFSAEELGDLESDEFRNYRLFRQGLAARAERHLLNRLREISARAAGTNLFVVSTVSLFPLVRYGEVLRQLRDLQVRLFIAFPGEERGGKLHFMNEPDGGNYLAVKITFRN
jgi:hypothetical protein